MALNFGEILGGIGAAFGGTAPQYVQGLKEEKQSQLVAREKAMYQDAAIALQLFETKQFEKLDALGMDRMDQLKQFSDAVPNDTLRMLSLNKLGMSGDLNARAQLHAELISANRAGQVKGYLSAPAAPEGYTLSEGQTRFESGRKVASVPAAPLEPKTMTDVNGIARYVLTGDPVFPNETKNVPTPESTVWQESEAMRKEFNSLQAVRDFDKQSTAYTEIIASATNPSPAGDIALIFNYMKVLDPASTVREGEQAMVANAGNVPDRVQALYNKLFTQGGSLSIDQRADLVKRSEKLYKTGEEKFGKIYDQYSGIAGRRKLPIEDVLVDYRYQQPLDSALIQPAPVQFDSADKAENAMLPAGTLIEYPDPKNPNSIIQAKVL